MGLFLTVGIRTFLMGLFLHVVSGASEPSGPPAGAITRHPQDNGPRPHVIQGLSATTSGFSYARWNNLTDSDSSEDQRRNAANPPALLSLPVAGGVKDTVTHPGNGIHQPGFTPSLKATIASYAVWRDGARDLCRLMGLSKDEITDHMIQNTFRAEGVWVKGAGETRLNGYYTRMEHEDGPPPTLRYGPRYWNDVNAGHHWYKQKNGPGHIRLRQLGPRVGPAYSRAYSKMDGHKWWITDAAWETAVGCNSGYYVNRTDDAYPPAEGWKAWASASSPTAKPAPTVEESLRYMTIV